MNTEHRSPCNLEAERSILGAVIVDSEAIDRVADKLTPNLFFRDAHRRIFERMLALSERRDAIDLVTLKEELARAGALDEVGGPAYVAALVDGVPRATNVEYYARIVKEKAMLRNVIAAASRILTSAYAADADAAAVIDEAERLMLDLSQQAVPGDLVPADEMVRNIYPVIESLTDARCPITGLETGFRELDRYTGGLQPGNLVILGGRPSQGKARSRRRSRYTSPNRNRSRSSRSK